MRDEDLIKRLQEADSEGLKVGLIEELKVQNTVAETLGAMWWNAYRTCLDSALKRYETR